MLNFNLVQILDLFIPKQKNKRPQCVNLRQFFLAWGEANPAHSRDAARYSGILSRGGRYTEGYKTLEDLERATDVELLKLNGIGPYGLKLIREIGGLKIARAVSAWDKENHA